jgi:ankyrin repeat protein
VACQFAARSGVIEYLIDQYKAGTMETDILGRLPLHYACSNGASLNVVRALLNVNTAATLYSDLNGWMPLHVAVHFGAETAVIKELLDVSPPSIVNMKTKKGNTAMCLARKITWKNKEEVLALLDHVKQGSGMTSDIVGLGFDEPKRRVESNCVPNAA